MLSTSENVSNEDKVQIHSLDNIENKAVITEVIFDWQRQLWGSEGVAIVANSLQTLVAMRNGIPIGCAALVKCDLPIFSTLSPWLAGVYVVPLERKHGIATLLINQIETFAKELCFKEIYLYSYLTEFYSKKGWEVICDIPNTNDTIMKKLFS